MKKYTIKIKGEVTVECGSREEAKHIVLGICNMASEHFQIEDSSVINAKLGI